MGVYTKAFIVLIGGLAGGSVGFYYQSKQEKKLNDLRRLKLDEMQKLGDDNNQITKTKSGN